MSGPGSDAKRLVRELWSLVSYPWKRPVIPYQTREQIVRDVVEAIEMYVDTRLERAVAALNNDHEVNQAYADAAKVNEGGNMNRGPIFGLIQRRDSAVAAAKITLMCAVAKIIPLPPAHP